MSKNSLLPADIDRFDIAVDGQAVRHCFYSTVCPRGRLLALFGAGLRQNFGLALLTMALDAGIVPIH